MMVRVGDGAADLDLDVLGGALADQEVVLALDVLDDRLVELVAADADRLAGDDAGE
jgi:actin-like ATPase involved in cell morphogenesis